MHPACWLLGSMQFALRLPTALTLLQLASARTSSSEGHARPGCPLSAVQWSNFPRSNSSYLPVFAVGPHRGPIRQRYDKLLENRTAWRSLCPRWLHGIPREYQYTSQFGQDWWLYTQIFKHYPANYHGVVVESAAYQPVKESNSFFFEKCLGWDSLVIEPQPQNYNDFLGVRRATIAPWCISDHREMVAFQTFTGTQRLASGLGKVKQAEENPHFKAMQQRASKHNIVEITVPCAPMQDIFDHFGVSRVDYLSLDVEGSELKAVQSIDFSKVVIDFITIEGSPSGELATNYLLQSGLYEYVDVQPRSAANLKNALARVDHLVVRKEHVLKIK
ncbi:MAG: hypothetical protein SGPRY_010617 [Prymnesium sp.]